MGAEAFHTIRPEQGANEAFYAAVSQAQYDHGHAGYSGTIAEKSEFTIIQTEPLPHGEAEILANKMIDEADPRVDDKWGPAGALPLADGGWLFFGWASC